LAEDMAGIAENMVQFETDGGQLQAALHETF
jgi:hypothetical protein